jgi:hypothetical protein
MTSAWWTSRSIMAGGHDVVAGDLAPPAERFVAGDDQDSDATPGSGFPRRRHLGLQAPCESDSGALTVCSAGLDHIRDARRKGGITVVTRVQRDWFNAEPAACYSQHPVRPYGPVGGRDKVGRRYRAWVVY